MTHYPVSVIEGPIMPGRTHRDLKLVERQVHRLKEDAKRLFKEPEIKKRRNPLKTADRSQTLVRPS